jgi:NTP pyrophosphatase (non-canonical NTP hydrolase)
MEKQMTDIFTRFKEHVEFRAKRMPTDIEDLLHGAVGIAGEAGELVDAVKKTWAYGQPLDAQNVVEELGDLLFYVQHMANKQGVSLQYLLEENIVKLTKRFPNGYSNADAIARADKE